MTTATHPQNSSRELVIILAYLVATVFFGALLAPLLFSMGLAAADIIEQFRLLEHRPLAWLHKVASESGFQRYFNRAVLISAVIGLWPLLRMLKMQRKDFGLRKDPFAAQHLILGFMLAAGLLLQLGLGLATAEVFEPKRQLDLGGALKQAAITAASVAVLEEVLFRGVLTGLLLRSLSARTTLVTIAVLFAALHFLKPPHDLHIAREAVGFGSGFWLVGVIFKTFTDTSLLLAEFGTLLMVGLLLGYTRWRTGALWLPIGLHAGWVFGVFAFRGVFTSARGVEAGENLPWIGDNLKTGILPL
ncbi:MAG: CPBP family intramembrane metalloprotease, partial [Verrucomicrobia bacterium]|nr:CPBP family intramembrane metalloprotease [Verrucomicrobiota bacterium]